MNAIGEVPDQTPGSTVTSAPSIAGPLICGRAVFTGVDVGARNAYLLFSHATICACCVEVSVPEYHSTSATREWLNWYPY